MANQYINYYEIITIFTIGVMFLVLISVLLKLKLKTILILAANSVIGTLIYVIMTIKITGFPPLDSVNVFLCGVSGLLGTLLVIIFTKLF